MIDVPTGQSELGRFERELVGTDPDAGDRGGVFGLGDAEEVFCLAAELVVERWTQSCPRARRRPHVPTPNSSDAGRDEPGAAWGRMIGRV